MYITHSCLVTNVDDRQLCKEIQGVKSHQEMAVTKETYALISQCVSSLKEKFHFFLPARAPVLERSSLFPNAGGLPVTAGRSGPFPSFSEPAGASTPCRRCVSSCPAEWTVYQLQ